MFFSLIKHFNIKHERKFSDFYASRKNFHHEVFNLPPISTHIHQTRVEGVEGGNHTRIDQVTDENLCKLIKNHKLFC
jgi:hypothetical protein